MPKIVSLKGMPAPGLWKLRMISDASIYSNDFGGFFSSDVDFSAGEMISTFGRDDCKEGNLARLGKGPVIWGL